MKSNSMHFFIFSIFVIISSGLISCDAEVETKIEIVEIEKKIYICPTCNTGHKTLNDALLCCKNKDPNSTTENPNLDENPNNLIIDGKNFGKTEFVTVIPEGKTATVKRPSNDVDESGRDYSDYFYSGKSVTISAYSMCKYEVTNELYEYVMKKLPIPDKENRYKTERQKYRPAQGISWYDAVIFCNKLSELKGYNPVYAISNIKYSNKGKTNEYISSADVTWNFSKNGYRLPTEAEWEYAARGAAKSETDWKYKYSGENNSKLVAWTSTNSAGYEETDYIVKTHEVGLKNPNAIGIYDMSGNVSEWCMDYFRTVTEKGDFKHGNRVYDKEASSKDPCMGKGQYENIVIRGGSYIEANGTASLWQRIGMPRYAGHGFSDSETYQGIRLVRRF